MSDITLNGKQLESVQVEITLPDTPSTPAGYHAGQPRQGLLRGFDYQYNGSNTVRIGFAAAPVVPEATNQNLQSVSVPSEVSGRFNEPNDEDVYRFAAEKGKTYCIEAIADRMASDVDVLLIVHKVVSAEDGSESLTLVAENDDVVSFFRVDG